MTHVKSFEKHEENQAISRKIIFTYQNAIFVHIFFASHKVPKQLGQ